MKIIKTTIKRLKIIALTLVLSVPAVFTSARSPALALTSSELQQQKNDIAQKIKDNVARVDDLSSQVDTLEDRITAIDGEISAAQNEIVQTETKITELTTSISETQTEIERQKELLKQNLIQMYKMSGSTSTELLFSSDDFSTYINNQEYLNTIKDGVKGSVDTIIIQKKQLEDSKTEQESLKTAVQARKVELEAVRVDRAELLATTQGEEAKYQAIVSELDAQQKEINRQIAALATSISYYGDGSYPWAGEGYPCSGSDPWGMCYRQCVSYTAWKVATTGRYMPTNWVSGRGNAINWPQNARNIGIPVDQTPRPGDIAVLMIGVYGHVMYVEDVYDNGTMYVSQYNFAWDGRYSEMVFPSYRSDMYFIHFPY